MRKIKRIFVHCSDSPDDMDIGFDEINQWHEEKGWKSPTGISCGYHYVIRRNGVVERGRPDNEVGAHVYRNNKDTLGIVWVGRDKPTFEQYKSLLAILRGLMNQYNVDIESVLGHCEVDHFKTCPNINMLKLRGDLLFTRFEDLDRSYKELIG